MTSRARRADSPVDPSTLSSRSEVSHDFDHHWQIIKSGFVDDPLTAVLEAGQLVAAMVDDWIERVQAECASLEANHTAAASTEQLRIKLQRYDDFVQRMSGNKVVH